MKAFRTVLAMGAALLAFCAGCSTDLRTGAAPGRGGAAMNDSGVTTGTAGDGGPGGGGHGGGIGGAGLGGTPGTGGRPARFELSFIAAVNHPVGVLPVAVAAGDLNGDGTPDLAFADSDFNGSSDGSVVVLVNRGADMFASPVSYPAGKHPSTLALGDVDGDGHLDIVAATQGKYSGGNYGDAGVTVLHNRGDGTFTSGPVLATAPALAVLLGDLDGDGWTDVVLSGSAPTGTDVRILWNDGGALAAPVAIAVGCNPRSLAIADLDGDGRANLAVPDPGSELGSGSIKVLMNAGGRRFASPVAHPVAGSPHGVAAGDLDDDGDADLVVANTGLWDVQAQALIGSFGVDLLVNDGNGSFADPPRHVAAPPSYYVALGDLDGDGRLDAALSSSGASCVVLGDGRAGLGEPVCYAAGSGSYPLALADLDGDGHTDVVAVDSRDANVLVNRGNGELTAALHFDTGATNSAGALAAADLNRDGNVDLVSATLDGTASVLWADGRGSFRPAVGVPAPFGVQFVAASDLDGDGWHDLAVIRSSGSASGSDEVRVLAGHGDAGFLAAGAYATDRGSSAVAVGDLDRDGRPDLVVANAGAGTLSVLRNTGGGAFAPASHYAAGSGPASLVIRDFDGDGDNDVAVANSSSGNVTVFRGDGRGAFAAGVSFAAGPTPMSIAAGDLDGDGKIDLAVANAYSNGWPGTVTVLLNDGGRGFQAAVDYAVGLFPTSVVIGDFDGDGQADLAVANRATGSGQSGDVSVLVNDGRGRFAGEVRFAAGFSPASLALADVNKDGKLDLAIGSSYGKVNVLINDSRRIEAP